MPKPKEVFDLRSQPQEDARTGEIVTTDLSVEILADAGNGWSRIKVTLADGSTIDGFARREWLGEEQSPCADAPREFDLRQFAARCLEEARIQGTNAHYLIAVAQIESSLKNVPASGSSGFGPFQILESTWEQYRSELGLTREDRCNPFQQPAVAAKIAADGTKALRSVLPDERLPTAAELYCTHFFGEAGAKKILHKDKDRNRSIRDALLEVHGNDAAKADKTINANRGLLAPQGQPVSVAALLKALESKFDEALKVAVKAIDLVDPELNKGPAADVAIGSPAAGDVPWMAIADAERRKPVVELVGSASNPEIEKYFSEIGSGRLPDDTAWCAAFTSWCIKQANIPAERKKKSVRAADWINFGTNLPAPQFGAVAVLHPLVQGASGHVGFVVKWNDTKVELLGGNQGTPNSVCVVSFPLTKVRGWRMM